jgi:hypothetical protein
MLMKYVILMVLFIGLNACTFNVEMARQSESSDQDTTLTTPVLNLAQAQHLSQLPMDCVEVEYPNKLNQVIGSAEDLKSPKQLHPAFYGCFDWHSSVHAHWSLVSLLKNFPELDNATEIRALLKKNITPKNIENEVDYFHGEHNQSWERTYGWAWLLKLAEELHTWNDPLARELEFALKPLTNLMVQRFREFIPKLHYPIRVGEHTNTAFGFAFAYDYALAVGNYAFVQEINDKSKYFFGKDRRCQLKWEPSGFDFLSPCLEELDIMRRVLPAVEFKVWLGRFLTRIDDKEFDIAVGEVSDRSDGKLVHLDGVNFSRAWVLYGLANQYPEYHHLRELANKHVQYSLPNLVGDSYEGGHWLGSFAIYALNQANNSK